ncbi:Exocyst complex component [Vigna angularis]|uniref:Exocyst complex component n=1 Tax=Phaseolus angularis TaxID=3914 RepID=A0A8T0KHB3_PHAAN|nr:Exocyst complex component [Vigna angularis]
MVADGFGKECSHVYSSCKREFVEVRVSRLGLQKLNIEDIHKMTWQDLDDEIEKWIKTSNVALKILFPSKQCLYGRTFFGFAFVFFNLLWSDHSVPFPHVFGLGKWSPNLSLLILPFDKLYWFLLGVDFSVILGGSLADETGV